jgi:transcriptional regulator with XRE-family HTH domain
MPKTKTPANVVGPQIRRVRLALGLTQEQLATKCQLVGLDISRATLAQIEAQFRCVVDSELWLLSRVLNTTTDSLYPHSLRSRSEKK